MGYEHIAISVEASAGTGKTTISVATAILLVQTGRYRKIIYVCFPCVEERLGYLPGSLEEKTALYFEPLREALIKCNLEPERVIESESNIENMKNGNAFIQTLTHNYLRGVNFENAVVILEECQNGYTDEVRKVLTRCHDSCKVIMLGNDRQCDLLKNKENSGFRKFREAFKGQAWYANCELIKNYRGLLANAADEVK